ncbi:MAG TPA: hypothetical protein VFM14_08735 [Gemmatimonadales bacterium]|nr:hypothetical protein [Gemmatimonadales bacterium]
MTEKRTRGAGVPPLQNPDVTGLTKPRQDDIIRESSTAPDRGEAAEEFLEEQQEQARETGRAADRSGAARASEARGGQPGFSGQGEETELAKHWHPKGTKSRRK